jgi:hypothetical protein
MRIIKGGLVEGYLTESVTRSGSSGFCIEEDGQIDVRHRGQWWSPCLLLGIRCEVGHDDTPVSIARKQKSTVQIRSAAP